MKNANRKRNAKTNLKKKTPYNELYTFLNEKKKPNKQILLSIILPVYNEERVIVQLLESLPLNDFIEIIVIDDNSTDRSLEEIQKVKRQKRLKILKHKLNRGYGGAIKTGMKYARGEVIVTMDSDGQHHPNDILTLIRPIFEGDVSFTIGSRYLGTNYYALPLSTRLGEAMIEKVIQVIYNVRIRNNQNGFRAFDNELIPIFMKAKFSGFAYATEVLIQAALYGFKIREVPIKVYHRIYGKSKIILRKLTLNLISCIILYLIRRFLAIPRMI